jgi:hypothetical protein
MRIVAWNCHSGPWSRKSVPLETLDADLAVVSECPQFTDIRGVRRWIGTNPHKGLGIFAKRPWRIRRVPLAVTLPRYVLPVQVTGPASFLLVGVWAMNDGRDRYVRGMHRAVDLCARLLAAQPCVFLGDLNSNSIWDHEHPATLSHSALVRKLESYGLVSAYHTVHNEAHGAERTATYFEHRRADRPYHLDYCFVPSAWVPGIRSVSIGEHAHWTGWSDHMPLTTELEFGTATARPRAGTAPRSAATRSPSSS